jgi:hypothetical protein
MIYNLEGLVEAAMPNSPSKLFDLTRNSEMTKDCSMCTEQQVNTVSRNTEGRKILTVEEYFDVQIQAARKHVEELCIKKAKLEALQLHKVPYDELHQLVQCYLF